MIEEFTVTIALNDRDRDKFDPFVGGEAVLATHTFSPPPNTFLAVGGAGFKDAAFSVLTVGALHSALRYP